MKETTDRCQLPFPATIEHLSLPIPRRGFLSLFTETYELSGWVRMIASAIPIKLQPWQTNKAAVHFYFHLRGGFNLTIVRYDRQPRQCDQGECDSGSSSTS